MPACMKQVCWYMHDTRRDWIKTYTTPWWWSTIYLLTFHGGIPWGGCGTGYSLPSIVTIGLLFSLCLDHRFIIHVNVLFFSCFNRYLKDHSLLWKSLLVLVKRLAFAFIQVVICMMLGFLHCVFGQHWVYYWFRTMYCGLWPTHSWFRRQLSK